MSKKTLQPWDLYPLFPVYAFTKLKKARKLVKKYTGLRFEPSGKEGTFTLYECKVPEKRIGIIFLDCDDSKPADKYAALAHECVHYAQAFAETISNTPLDDESFAYVMESAMLACIDQIGEEWFNATPQT